ncbi:MAG: threonine aldolase, partial [Bacteroidales bacterium]|nr:threonine aldolase [Bacteroidales bacterium]
NIIIFRTVEDITALQATENLKERGILVHAVGKQEIRMVTHLDISPEMVIYTCEILPGIFS